MPSTVMLTVRGLSKRFGPIRALREASFHVGEGEILGLTGPSGAGKSTLFQCVAGLVPADAGAVLDGDREVEPDDRKSVLLFLPDDIAPWRDHRAGWALDFAADAFRAERDWRGEIAAVLRLDELTDRRIADLSRGQRKRVVLAMVLIAPQRLTLLDEPFDGLDLQHARDVAAYLSAQSRRGRTLFVSMRSMYDAARFCDRLVLLSDGSVVADGTLGELRERSGKPNADLEEVFLALTAGDS